MLGLGLGLHELPPFVGVSAVLQTVQSFSLGLLNQETRHAYVSSQVQQMLGSTASSYTAGASAGSLSRSSSNNNSSADNAPVATPVPPQSPSAQASMASYPVPGAADFLPSPAAVTTSSSSSSSSSSGGSGSVKSNDVMLQESTLANELRWVTVAVTCG